MFKIFFYFFIIKLSSPYLFALFSLYEIVWLHTSKFGLHNITSDETPLIQLNVFNENNLRSNKPIGKSTLVLPQSLMSSSEVEVLDEWCNLTQDGKSESCGQLHVIIHRGPREQVEQLLKHKKDELQNTSARKIVIEEEDEEEEGLVDNDGKLYITRIETRGEIFPESQLRIIAKYPESVKYAMSQVLRPVKQTNSSASTNISHSSGDALIALCVPKDEKQKTCIRLSVQEKKGSLRKWAPLCSAQVDLKPLIAQRGTQHDAWYPICLSTESKSDHVQGEVRIVSYFVPPSRGKMRVKVCEARNLPVVQRTGKQVSLLL